MIGGGNWTPWNAGARSETLGVSTSSATNGTSITPDVSGGTYGSWVDVGGTTSFDYKRLLVTLLANSPAANHVVNIGINVGGNRFIIAEDLYFSTARRAANEGNNYYELPLFVPRGAQLSAQIANNGTATDSRISIIGFSAGVAGAAPFSRCRALYTQSSGKGVTVDPGGSAHTKGSWAELTASSGFNAAALMFAIGFNNDVGRSSLARLALDIGIGAGGSEQILLANFLMGWSSVVDGPFISSAPILPFYIPSGTRIAARAQCSITTAGDRTIDIAAWGFEP